MKYSTPRHPFGSLMVFFQISLSCAWLFTSTASAQTGDTEPPTVTFETVSEAIRGDSQVFTVTATDNVGIESLSIFYRLTTEQLYKQSVMTRIGNSDLYSFTLAADAIPDFVGVIQYYIEAKDAEGNRTLQGFSFDPLERVLRERSSVAVADATQPEAESSSLIGSLSTTQKVLIGALGVVVVGALIAGADSDDDGGGTPQTSGVPLTITVNPLVVTP